MVNVSVNDVVNVHASCLSLSMSACRQRWIFLFCHSECFSQRYSSQTDAPNSPSVGLRCQLVQAKKRRCPRQFPFCL